MKLELNEVPFSRRGSYMALSWHEGTFNHRELERGLYLRTVRGAAGDPFVARLVPLWENAPAACTAKAEPSALWLEEEGREGKDTQKEGLELMFVYSDDSTILIRGRGEKTGLCLDFLTETGPFDFIQPVLSGEETWYLANCFKNHTRYMLYNQKGRIRLEQNWLGSRSDDCRFMIHTQDGEFLLILEEVRTDWYNRHIRWDIEKEEEKARQEFETFCQTMPQAPKELEEVRRMASYVNWSSIVKKDGFLKRDAMYMSKNWMCNVWSWDHCFNAIALAAKAPKMAWDQFMILFDHQTAAGRLPDSINDSIVIDNYCKPPIHGWALHKMRKRMQLTREMMEEACDKLGKWTMWWINYRDQDGDGLCEYTHGNDSGWDNATAFQYLPPVTLPDLAAFLILQMEELAELSGLLGRRADAEEWKRKADRMKGRMLEKLFRDNLPVGIQTVTGKQITTKSLIFYLPVVLAKRLPEEIRKAMIDVLKNGAFRTDYGFATEATESGLYEADGYWRGPIWAPSTMILLDGLWECGETEWVKDMTWRFCRMVEKSGCAENFDARTGEGLRDRAYTWTASAMLVMAEEYLNA